MYPVAQVQVWEPGELVHRESQPPLSSLHSSTENCFI